MFLLFSKIRNDFEPLSAPMKWFLTFGQEVKNVGPRSKLQGTDSVISIYLLDMGFWTKY